MRREHDKSYIRRHASRKQTAALLTNGYIFVQRIDGAHAHTLNIPKKHTSVFKSESSSYHGADDEQF
jgi:hypothetical protein